MKPASIHSALPKLIEKRRPVFIWGAPGVGKSDVVAQVAASMKHELRDVRLSLLDPVDLKGFPQPKDGKMSWLPPDFLPTKGKGILFLDEMNSAPQSVQAAAYQLVLNRKIGDYMLPAGWAIVAAGNRTSDRSVVHAMPAALANRFVHLDFDINVDDWAHWAKRSGLSSDLRAFIRFRPNLLHCFDAAQNPRAFPSPRSWAFVNDVLDGNHTPENRFELIKGTVGEGAAAEFEGFLRLAKDLPSIDQILLEPEKTNVPTEPASLYALVTALDQKAKPDNFDRMMKYVGRMPVEFQVVFVRSCVNATPNIANTPTFRDWGLKHQDVFI